MPLAMKHPAAYAGRSGVGNALSDGLGLHGNAVDREMPS
jgi:hypothetical protein